MLNDTALLVTGLAFVSILGGAWLLQRRAQVKPAAPSSAFPAKTASQASAPAVAAAPSGSASSFPTSREPAHSGDSFAPEAGAPAVNIARRLADAPKAAATGATASRAQVKIETLVLKAALEDALEHLAEVYGEEYLDAFYERRIRRNVIPYRNLVASSEDPAAAQQGLRYAAEAEEALRQAVATVRKTVKVAQA